MTDIRNHAVARTAARSFAVVAVGGALAACTGYMGPNSPQPVQATRPSVTYTYRTDLELVEATRNAESYCRTYSVGPRSANISVNPDGSKTVVFYCDRPV